jgi:hypothetical protein
MSDIIDINVAQTVEEVTINVTEEVIQVNINTINGGGGGIESVVAGTNITVDNTDPLNPIINANADAVTSVNSDIGDVIVDLQSVTDEGNITSNPIIFNDGSDEFELSGTSIKYKAIGSGFVKELTFDSLSANRNLILPNSDGTLVVQSDLENYIFTEQKTADFDAVNSSLFTANGTITVTDPTPLTNKGYIVHVIGGTSTIGGVGYTTGDLVYRYYDGASWISTNMNSAITIDATPTDGSSNAVSSNGVFDALALKQDDLWSFKNKGIILIDDFNLTNSNNFLSISAVGGNPQPSNTYPNRTNQNGVVYINTGTSASGYSTYISPTTPYFIGLGAISYEVYVNVETLSDATNRFYNIFGFGNFSNAINPQQGIFFLYDEGGVLGYGVNPPSPNWKCLTISTPTRTFTTTSVPVTASAWVKLRIEINASATSVEFYIDDVLVATHTTNIPSTSTALSISNAIFKTIGTTNRQAYLDYAIFRQIFTTTR